MNREFWLRRFGRMYLIVLVLLSGAELLKGHEWRDAIGHGLLWAGISALVYCAVLAWQVRQERVAREKLRGPS